MAYKFQNTTACGPRHLILAIVCLYLVSATVTNIPQLCVTGASHTPTAEERLGHMCKRISSIKRLSEMQELIDSLRQMVEFKRPSRSSDANRGLKLARDKTNPLPSMALTSTLVVSLTGSYSVPLRFFNQNLSAPCLAQAAAILDLGELIRERNNVCSSEHIDRIERYYERHLKAYYAHGEHLKTRPAMARSNSIASKPGVKYYDTNPGKPITTKFFSIYANQVSFVCKSNLLHSLNVVDDSGLVAPGDYDKVLPWLTQESANTCERIERLVDEQTPDSREKLVTATIEEDGVAKSAAVTQEDVRHCKARKLLMVLSNVDELVEVIESSQNYTKLNANQQGQGPNGAVSSGLFLIVPDNQKQVVGDMLNICAKLRPVYEQTVLPIVRLARLGFNPTHTNFDKVCSGDQLIKRWFGLTLVCNSMLISQLPSDVEKYKNLIKGNNIGRRSFVVVDEDDGTNEMSSSIKPANQTLDLIDQEVLRSLIKNSIEDELWIYKYGTTKLQRIKDSIMKKVFKLFGVEDINSHIVFRKRVSDTSRWIVRVVLISLALVTFDYALR